DDTGATFADVGYDDPGHNVFGFLREPSLLFVQFVYDGTGWHLSAEPNLAQEMQYALCSVGSAILYSKLLGGRPANFNSPNALSNRGVEGCLLSAQLSEQEHGTFLWRFGALLAADAGAHTLLPDLPIAPQAEVAAAGG